MRRLLFSMLVVLAAPAVTGAADAPAVAKSTGFDIGVLDRSVDPCDDFYEYACGTWRKNNPIPSDQSRWGRFNELADYNRQFLHNILEKDSANDPKRTPVQQKIGDMYASCMDETTVNAKGNAPLKPELDRIAAITNKEQLVATIAYLHSVGRTRFVWVRRRAEPAQCQHDDCEHQPGRPRSAGPRLLL